VSLDLSTGAVAKRDLLTVDEKTTVLDAARLMVEHDVGSLVVERNRERIGILTERDILKKVVAKSLHASFVTVKEVMSSPPVTIPHDRPLREAVDLMNRRRVRRMLVTEGGKIVGIVTQRDILAYNRICLYCGKQIKSVMEFREPEPYLECTCGARYHTRCAETVVNCTNCSRTLVTHVIYPEPSETSGG
jgi:CBS domain-containing protein